jgi:hypothetical protein
MFSFEIVSGGRKMKINLRWVLIGVLAIIPVTYLFFRIVDLPFRDSLMGNWFATMVGALAGILTAIEINNSLENKEKQNKEVEETQRKEKILSLIKEELTFNLDELLLRRPNQQEQKIRTAKLPGLKDELWNAFSDGGEIQWINDPQLLDAITKAYYYIRSVIFLEEKYFDVLHFPGIRVNQASPPESRILGYLTENDSDDIEHIKKAIFEIGNVLQELAIKKY